MALKTLLCIYRSDLGRDGKKHLLRLSSFICASVLLKGAMESTCRNNTRSTFYSLTHSLRNPGHVGPTDPCVFMPFSNIFRCVNTSWTTENVLMNFGRFGVFFFSSVHLLGITFFLDLSMRLFLPLRIIICFHPPHLGRFSIFLHNI